MTPGDLAADTAVKKVAKVPGAYVAAVPDHWNYLNPSGGALLTIALRAMTEELGAPELPLLSASTLFCSAVHAGAVSIEARVLRRGDTAAQVRASLRQRGESGPGLEVMATFAQPRKGPEAKGISMPPVPSPAECIESGERVYDPARSSYPFPKNFEMAQALGEVMWKKGWEAGEAHVAHWYRYRTPQRLPDGLFDPLALPPIADTMPGALSRKLGAGHPRFIAPSLDLTMFFLAPTRSEWILVESFCEHARDGYAVCSANLWDEAGVLVARAAQSMTLREFRAS